MDEKKKGGCLKNLCLAILSIIVIFVFVDLGDEAPSNSTTPTLSPDETTEIRAEAKKRVQRSHEIEFQIKVEKTVRQLLKNPGSVKFQDLRFLSSDEFGDCIIGKVNAKNDFNAYSGFRGFISNGRTTLLEGRDKGYIDAFSKLNAAHRTRRTLESIAVASEGSIPLVFDITGLSGKSVSALETMLGNARVEQTNAGEKRIYQDGLLEIVFKNGQILVVTVNNLDKIPYTIGAIQSLGLEKSSPTFASELVLKWQDVAGIAEISIFKGQENCDYALLKF